jgi:hypothetical protein
MERGGNAHSWRVYEAYIPEGWKQRRPMSSSSLSQRLVFCRAKYEALAFCLPSPGPLANKAWASLLKHNALGKKYGVSSGLQNIVTLTTSMALQQSGGVSSAKTKASSSSSKDALPNRLVNHFCVVSSSMQLLPSLVKKKNLSTIIHSPEDLMFWPYVSDCYPDKSAYQDDMEFPEHLSTFVMPKGCHPVLEPKPPSFFSFVLTMGDGTRLYGGALEIYDEHVDMEELKTAIEESGYTGKVPAFLADSTEENGRTTDGKPPRNKSTGEFSDVVFFPKCLVVLSHHGFFDLFRSVLLELYQISLMAAPIPIERYIANFVREVPLPPQGSLKVEFAFTTEKKFVIERPPINKLPMADFSYRPLFASLSVGNIIAVLGCLLEERKVVVLSQHCSMLTPVTEALLSALFPFQWVGIYIVSRLRQ